MAEKNTKEDLLEVLTTLRRELVNQKARELLTSVVDIRAALIKVLAPLPETPLADPVVAHVFFKLGDALKVEIPEPRYNQLCLDGFLAKVKKSFDVWIDSRMAAEMAYNAAVQFSGSGRAIQSTKESYTQSPT